MPTLITETIDDFTKYTDYILKTQEKADSVLWYRGCGKYGHVLQPSLFRHPKTDIVELLKLENSLVNRFIQRGYPFIDRELSDDDWERLFYMQHYGLPTRLLDWSESPYMALYFAVSSAPTDDLGKFTEDAAVWILDPIRWNHHVFPHRVDEIDIISRLNAIELQGYEPKVNPAANVSSLLDPPIAMYGTHNSHRIVGQRGVFTMFGKDTAAMENTYLGWLNVHKSAFPDNLLIKVKLPKDSLEHFAKILLVIGISDSVVFPDLVGLAKETKRFFGYKV